MSRPDTVPTEKIEAVMEAATEIAADLDHASKVLVHTDKDGAPLPGVSIVDAMINRARRRALSLCAEALARPCPECAGEGVIHKPVLVPVCCGYVRFSGECCAQPVQDWDYENEPCGQCLGHGYFARARSLTGDKTDGK